MTVTPKYNIGNKLFFLLSRDARVDPVCGACEGAKVFLVPHLDGEMHELPCAKCKGKGSIYSGKSVTVYDVKSLLITGFTIEVGWINEFVSYVEPKVSYHGKSGGKTHELTREGSPKEAWNSRTTDTFFWTDKEVAGVIAEAWTKAAQADAASRAGYRGYR